jgi:hypothetical protein
MFLNSKKFLRSQIDFAVERLGLYWLIVVVERIEQKLDVRFVDFLTK